MWTWKCMTWLTCMGSSRPCGPPTASVRSSVSSSSHAENDGPAVSLGLGVAGQGIDRLGNHAFARRRILQHEINVVERFAGEIHLRHQPFGPPVDREMDV